MLMLQTYRNAWPLCLALFGFFVALSVVAHFFRVPRCQWSVSARGLFWTSLISWLVVMSIVTTLIDSPYLPVPHEAIVWMFMISAFVGLPLTVPLLAAAVWALATSRVRGARVRLSTLGLLLLGTFSLGAVTSNMHDVLWCGVITHGYAQPHPAGGDLAAFYFVARWFALPEKMMCDYATFGSCMVIMVAGELLLAAVCLRRAFKIEAAGALIPCDSTSKQDGTSPQARDEPSTASV